MLLRRPHEVAALFREGRRRAGWSQTELAERIGASRQWVSLVETGKTSAEFDLVLASLQALGYAVIIGPREDATAERGSPGLAELEGPHDAPDPTPRTPLTRDGEPLGHAAATERAPERSGDERG